MAGSEAGVDVVLGQMSCQLYDSENWPELLDLWYGGRGNAEEKCMERYHAFKGEGYVR